MRKLLFLLLIGLLISCKKSDPPAVNNVIKLSPSIALIDSVRDDSDNFLKYDIEVQNIGTDTAFEILAIASVYHNDTFDASDTEYVSVTTMAPDQKRNCQMWFTKLKGSKKYYPYHLTYELIWYDRKTKYTKDYL